MTPTNPFQRYDETDDRHFYRQPRLVNHIDEAALLATTHLYAEYLPAGGNLLDLMSSWVSHLPTHIPYGRVAGLGLNEVELKANPQLTEYVVQNLNQRPRLGYGDNSFDGGMMTVSVQYLTQPVLVYQELARVLRPGSPFLTVFSNRMFASKAVAIWQSLDDQGHQQLVRWYYEQSGRFDPIKVLDRSPSGGHDPLFAVVGWVKQEHGSSDASSSIGSLSQEGGVPPLIRTGPSTVLCRAGQWVRRSSKENALI